MSDLNTRLVAAIKTLRETQATAQPTQELDSTTVLTLNIPTQRAKSLMAKKDLNTGLFLGYA